ncbi:MAG: hypothetical protein LBR39_00510 [Coriobacteriales bacterium]|jgi:hypothetical protein|nr:hypothetical protein [Coriobacteriales bacterium]
MKNNGAHADSDTNSCSERIGIAEVLAAEAGEKSQADAASFQRLQKRTGFMAELEIPMDFDTMMTAEIHAMFTGVLPSTRPS